ncbi:MAG: hypothetical protein AAGU75_02100 [Bacillota bacterium]
MYYIAQLRDSNFTSGQINLIFKSRMLWRDMGSWTRTYIISLFAGIGDQEVVSQRLHKVPLEFGNTFKVFFGEAITEHITNLLTNYITLLQSIFNAQKIDDIDAVKNYTKQLYETIDQLAAYLAQINPFWQENDWKNFLYNYTQMVIDESATFLERDYVRNIEIYDRLLSLSSVIGDYFSEGLLNYINYSGRQF